MRRTKTGSAIYLTLALATILMAAQLATANGHEKSIHIFHGTPGAFPLSGVIADASGNLYGTTSAGGGSCGSGIGCGTVFSMSPVGNGWSFITIYVFQSKTDGFEPSGPLLLANGNIYGTTSGGGAFSHGTVFQLTPDGNGQWAKNTVYSFGAYSHDGTNPEYGVVADAQGNLYGTSSDGGQDNLGTVFELQANADGTWTESILHSFAGNGVDGELPSGPLTFDSLGNLYGSASNIVFELVPAGEGTWAENILYTFLQHEQPVGGIVFDASGNIFGATNLGGGKTNAGSVYKLIPTEGSWAEIVIHRFQPSQGDGANPDGPIAFDSVGNIVGTTYAGGTFGYGTVFRLTPQANGNWIENGRYNFTGGTDGANPQYGRPIFNAAGDILGTTSNGGNGVGQAGYGVVFGIRP